MPALSLVTQLMNACLKVQAECAAGGPNIIVSTILHRNCVLHLFSEVYVAAPLLWGMTVGGAVG